MDDVWRRECMAGLRQVLCCRPLGNERQYDELQPDQRAC